MESMTRDIFVVSFRFGDFNKLRLLFSPPRVLGYEQANHGCVIFIFAQTSSGAPFPFFHGGCCFSSATGKKECPCFPWQLEVRFINSEP